MHTSCLVVVCLIQLQSVHLCLCFCYASHTLPTPGENQSLFPPHGAWNIYISNSCSLLKWSFREACSLLQNIVNPILLAWLRVETEARRGSPGRRPSATMPSPCTGTSILTAAPSLDEPSCSSFRHHGGGVRGGHRVAGSLYCIPQ